MNEPNASRSASKPASRSDKEFVELVAKEFAVQLTPAIAELMIRLDTLHERVAVLEHRTACLVEPTEE